MAQINYNEKDYLNLKSLCNRLMSRNMQVTDKTSKLTLIHVPVALSALLNSVKVLLYLGL